MTDTERAHWYEHSDPECGIPKCTCCPALAEQFRQVRVEALEDAALAALRLNDWGGYADAPNIARRIRDLAPPTAPESPTP